MNTKLKLILGLFIFLSVFLFGEDINFESVMDVSSTVSVEYPAENVLDDDVQSFCSFDEESKMGFIVFDLGEERFIDGITITATVAENSKLILEYKDDLLWQSFRSFKYESDLFIDLSSDAIVTDRLAIRISGLNLQEIKIYNVSFHSRNPNSIFHKINVREVKQSSNTDYFYPATNLVDNNINTGWRASLGNNFSSVVEILEKMEKSECPLSNFATDLNLMQSELLLDSTVLLDSVDIYLEENFRGSLNVFAVSGDFATEIGSVTSPFGGRWISFSGNGITADKIRLDYSGNMQDFGSITEVSVWGYSSYRGKSYLSVAENLEDNKNYIGTSFFRIQNAFQNKYRIELETQETQVSCINAFLNETPIQLIKESSVNGSSIFSYDANWNLFDFNEINVLTINENVELHKRIKIVTKNYEKSIINDSSALSDGALFTAYQVFESDLLIPLKNEANLKRVELFCNDPSLYYTVSAIDNNAFEVLLEYEESNDDRIRVYLADGNFSFLRISSSTGQINLSEVKVFSNPVVADFCDISIEYPENGRDLAAIDLLVGKISDPECTVTVNGKEVTQIGSYFWINFFELGLRSGKSIVVDIKAEKEGRVLNQISETFTCLGVALIGFDQDENVLHYTSEPDFNLSGWMSRLLYKLKINGKEESFLGSKFNLQIPLQEGYNSITTEVYTKLTGKVIKTTTFKVLLSSTPPVLNIRYPFEGCVVSNNLIAQGAVYGLGIDSLLINSRPFPVISSGFYAENVEPQNSQVVFQGQDLTGRSIEKTVNVNIMNDLPEIEEFTCTTGDFSLDGFVSFQVKIKENRLCFVYINDRIMKKVGDYYLLDFYEEFDGEKEYVVVAKDKAGNFSLPMTKSVMIDTEGPEFTELKANPSSWTNVIPDIHFSAIDYGIGLDHFEISLNDSEFVVANSPYKPLSLPEGISKVKVRAIDKYDYITEAEISIYIDRIAPELPTLFKVISGNEKATLKWEHPEKGIKFNIKRIHIENGETLEFVSDGSLHVDDNLVNGRDYKYQICAFDVAGNYSLYTSFQEITAGMGKVVHEIGETAVLEYENISLNFSERTSFDLGYKLNITEIENNSDLESQMDFTPYQNKIYYFSGIDEEGNKLEDVAFGSMYLGAIRYDESYLPPGISEKHLTVYNYDSMKQRWVLASSFYVDIEENIIYFFDYHFSLWTVGSNLSVSDSYSMGAPKSFDPIKIPDGNGQVVVSPLSGSLSVNAIDLEINGHGSTQLEIGRNYNNYFEIKDSSIFDLESQVVPEATKYISRSKLKEGCEYYRIGNGWKINLPAIEDNKISNMIGIIHSDGSRDLFNMNVDSARYIDSSETQRILRVNGSGSHSFLLIIKQSKQEKIHVRTVVGEEKSYVEWRNDEYSVIHGNGEVHQFNYLGQITRIQNKNKQAFEFEYNSKNLLTNISSTFPGKAKTKLATFEYIARNYPGSSVIGYYISKINKYYSNSEYTTVSYQLDANNRLRAVYGLAGNYQEFMYETFVENTSAHESVDFEIVQEDNERWMDYWKAWNKIKKLPDTLKIDSLKMLTGDGVGTIWIERTFDLNLQKRYISKVSRGERLNMNELEVSAWNSYRRDYLENEVVVDILSSTGTKERIKYEFITSKLIKEKWDRDKIVETKKIEYGQNNLPNRETVENAKGDQFITTYEYDLIGNPKVVTSETKKSDTNEDSPGVIEKKIFYDYCYLNFFVDSKVNSPYYSISHKMVIDSNLSTLLTSVFEKDFPEAIDSYSSSLLIQKEVHAKDAFSESLSIQSNDLYYYDSNGLLVEAAEKRGTTWYKEKVGYDLNAFPVEHIDTLGNKTLFEYDDYMNMSSIIREGVDGERLINAVEVNKFFGKPVKEYIPYYQKDSHLRKSKDIKYDKYGRSIQKSSPQYLNQENNLVFKYEVTTYEDNLNEIINVGNSSYKVQIQKKVKVLTFYGFNEKEDSSNNFRFSKEDFYDTVGNLVYSVEKMYPYSDEDLIVQENIKEVEKWWYYDVHKKLIYTIDGERNERSYLYDHFGALSATFHPSMESHSSFLKENFEHDYLTNSINTLYENGFKLTAEFDVLNRQIRSTKSGRTRKKNVIVDELYETQYFYDGLGNQVKVSYPNGSSEISKYDGYGNLIYKENNADDLVEIGSDGVFNEYTDAKNCFEYFYDGNNNLIKESNYIFAGGIKHDKIETEYFYDNYGRLKSKNYSLKNYNQKELVSVPIEEKFFYSADDIMLKKELYENNLLIKHEEFVYNYNQDLTLKTANDLYSIVKIYDKQKNKVVIYDSRGAKDLSKKYSIEHYYDNYDNEILSIAFTDDLSPLIIRNGYNSNNLLISTVNPLGAKVFKVYNGNNYLVEEVIFENNRQISKTNWMYNSLGQVKRKFNSEKQLFENEIDSFGRVIKQTGTNGIINSYEYDFMDRLSYVENGLGDDLQITETLYNKSGTVRQVSSGNNRESLSIDSIYKYDRSRNQTVHENTNGLTAYTFYNFKGWLLKEKNHYNYEKFYDYFSDGRIKNIYSTDDFIISYSYQYALDGFGYSIEYSDGSESEIYNYGFDAVGNKLNSDGNGVSKEYQYSPLGQVTGLEIHTGDSILLQSFTYDLAGNNIKIVHGHLDTPSYVLEKTFSESGLLSTVQGFVDTPITYNKYGLRAQMVTNSDINLKFEYDDSMVLEKRDYSINSKNIYSHTFERNSTGNIIRNKIKNEDVEYKMDYEYNSRNQLVAERVEQQDIGNEMLIDDFFKVDYGYNSEDYFVQKKLDFDYNSANTTFDSRSSSIGVEFDNPKIITKVELSSKDIPYIDIWDIDIFIFTRMSNAYEKVSGRFHKTDEMIEFILDYKVLADSIKVHCYTDSRDYQNLTIDNGNVNLNSLILSVFTMVNRTASYGYSYNENLISNRVTYNEQPAKSSTLEYLSVNGKQSDLILSDGTYSYTYDNKGNLLSKKTTQGKEWKYEYSLRGDLSNVLYSPSDGEEFNSIVSYLVDADGVLVSKKSTEEDVDYLYDLNGWLFAQLSGSKSEYYIRDEEEYIGKEVFENNKKDKYYFVNNFLGSIIKVYDSFHKVCDIELNSFGSPLNDDNDYQKPIFTGKLFHPEVDLYYFNARWYDSYSARFITEDPIKDGKNWYLYCNGNPIMFTDSSGLSAEGSIVSSKHFDSLYSEFKTLMQVVNNFESEDIYTRNIGYSNADVEERLTKVRDNKSLVDSNWKMVEDEFISIPMSKIKENSKLSLREKNIYKSVLHRFGYGRNPSEIVEIEIEKLYYSFADMNNDTENDWIETWQNSGYVGILFKNDEQDLHVMAFGSTNFYDGADVWTDIIQALGIPSRQYQHAVENSFLIFDHLKNDPSDNYIYDKKFAAVGHSLGGGLASVVAVKNNILGVTLNAAGINFLTSWYYLGSHTQTVKTAYRCINALYVTSCPLTIFQDYTFLPNAIGNRIRFASFREAGDTEFLQGHNDFNPMTNFNPSESSDDYKVDSKHIDRLKKVMGFFVPGILISTFILVDEGLAKMSEGTLPNPEEEIESKSIVDLPNWFK